MARTDFLALFFRIISILYLSEFNKKKYKIKVNHMKKALIILVSIPLSPWEFQPN